ncbi:type II toxin-antitoxin system RelE/ParE family toxin [Candidatus Regiella endosymbiont of Tuberolachnus salignus]|uniref:type II toxin-antitoxin system RelE/ParE family toxin n=1 Tax=Candidatus Regiella endosymbiont of Tuberolachnus salignus TaxID=3077956 RepID=UPI0030CF9C3F
MWTVIFTPRFDVWLQEQEEGMQEKILADLTNLETYGSKLSRPYADTVKGSRHKNMKELRVQYSGRPVRAFFAFDPKRQAIVLCAGDKSNDKRFYDTMIRVADEEFTAHLTVIEEQK